MLGVDVEWTMGTPYSSSSSSRSSRSMALTSMGGGDWGIRGDSSIVSGIRSMSGAPIEEPKLRARKRLSCGTLPREGGLRARAVREEELEVELSKRIMRDEEGCWDPWPEVERVCMRSMPGLTGVVGSGGISSPGVDDELVERCHGFGSGEARAKLVSSLRRWRSCVGVSCGDDESGVGKRRGEDIIAAGDTGDAVPGTGTGDEEGGELIGGSETEVTLDEEASTFDFLNRLRSDSFEFSLRGDVTSAPVPADLGRREAFGSEGRWVWGCSS